MSAAELKSQLAALPTGDRADLALFLIDSLSDKKDEGANEAWREELQRRADQDG
jgi:hypothetical protein